MVSARPPFSKSSSLCTNPLVIVPRAPITSGITITLMFYCFFSSLAWSWYLFLFIIILLIWEFFTLALADSLPLELEWQKVSSSLQDTSQYSGRCQLCCSLDSPLVLLFPSSPFPILILWWLYLAPQLQSVSLLLSCSIVFQFLSNVQVLNSLFVFLQFYPVIS